MIRAFVGGVKVDNMTMAVDDLRHRPLQRLPLHRLTYQHMRELSVSKLLDRRVRMEWEPTAASTCAPGDGQSRRSSPATARTPGRCG